MATVENPRLWSKVGGYIKRVTSLRELSAWSLSFVVHATILVLLASLTPEAGIRAEVKTDRWRHTLRSAELQRKE